MPQIVATCKRSSKEHPGVPSVHKHVSVYGVGYDVVGTWEGDWVLYVGTDDGEPVGVDVVGALDGDSVMQNSAYPGQHVSSFTHSDVQEHWRLLVTDTSLTQLSSQ